MCVCACALTGLERDKFDNKTVTFEEHIKVEHNMWHYLFFIVLIKVKDSTEYTGPESYVAEMIRVRVILRMMKACTTKFNYPQQPSIRFANTIDCHTVAAVKIS